MTFRKADTTDASSLAALSIEVWVGTYLKEGVSPHFADFVLDAFTPSKIAALIADPKEFILVSDNETGIDGYIRLTSNSAAPVSGCSDLEISTFYIQPRHHGKGIGTRLLEAAFEYAAQLGVSSVWLATNAENAPAIAFYLSKGFEQLGETQFTIDGNSYLNNVYSRKLR
ncbi:GNAT family N-acetyltransferase [Sulfitobacter donghicola]|uniref:GCN5 family acetyltransferase n=1 Tax=Sulfitobacter donghicola DSW-25 = KCTC 12864 = JCM 14565 TaxID=1300350 RepID=A0A073IKG6_9RHOB|nr:GNAT family N-acetyltransferase [Sulfitobacter donghicola]KEJ90259.1 GCN5 family acetyltransferase [Sulfitobacter donghicola DSW-25 = KCTC 12864 = JCM 14565]